jgi:peptidoglycan/xylan/chitin deacetylase (PgdA/CDA1 family)
MQLHPMFRDRTLHIILISAIVILSGTTIYFRFFFVPMDPLDKVFLATYGNFSKEIALQNIPETVQPGSVQVPILVYHSVFPHTLDQSPLQKYYDVSPESFIHEMQYLKDSGYTVISLDALARALDQNIILPPKSVVLTFDDGWRNQYAYAFPVLEKYNFTATFFIYTDAIDHDYFLTWDQVRLINNAGMTIGGHAESHPYLPDIHDPTQLRKEIIGGKKIIEDQIRQKIYLFAYPFGHYNDEIVSIVKEAGYIAARSTYAGISHTKDDLYTLRAVEVTDDFNKFTQALTY